jgi:hypothetical protein
MLHVCHASLARLVACINHVGIAYVHAASRPCAHFTCIPAQEVWVSRSLGTALWHAIACCSNLLMSTALAHIRPDTNLLPHCSFGMVHL